MLGCCSAQASIVLGGTRIVYPSNKSEVQIALKNKDLHTRYLVQSWVSNPDATKAPIVVTPPVYKLQENRQTLLHIIYTGDKNALPKDRESLFVANVKSVSALAPELKDKNTLQFAMKTRLKLFWRPSQLKESDALEAWEKITFHRQGTQLVAKNPTPFYVSRRIGRGGKPCLSLKQNPSRCGGNDGCAHSEQTFTLPAEPGAVTWTPLTTMVRKPVRSSRLYKSSCCSVCRRSHITDRF
ncbi:MAG: molecular chaperone [Enterobacter hormaechei]